MMQRKSSWWLFGTVLLLLMGGGGHLFAQKNAQVLFDQANAKLQEGAMREAITVYKQIEASEYRSGALFLNLGIAYTAIDSLGMAKYYFLKAERFEETEPQSKEALEYINARFSRQSAVLPKLPWQVAFNWLIVHLGPEQVRNIGLLLLNLGVMLFVLRWFVRLKPTLMRRLGITFATAGLLIGGLSFYLHHLDDTYAEAVMIHEETVVREKPQEDAVLVSKAYEGYTFTVNKKASETSDTWYYVRMSNGLYGWIPKSQIRIL